MKDNFNFVGEIKNGKIDIKSKAIKTLYKEFLEKFPDGTKIEMFISANNGKPTLAQLAKMHAMIKELSNDLGYTFEEMKYEVKFKAGLIFQTGGETYAKSFADCDKEELSLAINAAIEIGDFNNINLR